MSSVSKGWEGRSIHPMGCQQTFVWPGGTYHSLPYPTVHVVTLYFQSDLIGQTRSSRLTISDPLRDTVARSLGTYHVPRHSGESYRLFHLVLVLYDLHRKKRFLR